MAQSDVQERFKLDDRLWNAMQRTFASSTHSDLCGLTWPARRTEARKKWHFLKLVADVDQEREYKSILSAYAPESAAPTLSPVTTEPNIPPGIEVPPPPPKRRRIGGKHKQHTAPKILLLKATESSLQSQLAETSLLLRMPNLATERMKELLTQQDDALSALKAIGGQIKKREQNNVAVRKCRERQKVVVEYAKLNRETIIADPAYAETDIPFYDQPGRPRLELLSKGRGLTQCIQSTVDEVSSADPKRRSDMRCCNLSLTQVTKEVNRKMAAQNGTPLNISTTAVYNRTSMYIFHRI